MAMLFKKKISVIAFIVVHGAVYFCYKNFYKSNGPQNIQKTAVEFQCQYTSGKKYVTSNNYTGRLGNMIFRFASLYGIGRSTGRNVYVSDIANDEISTVKEFFQIFPHMSKTIEVKPTSCRNIEKTVRYALDPCKYDPPSNLKEYNESKYIRIEGTYLQSFKYFERYKADLQKLMKCNSQINEKAKFESFKMWQNENDSHKLCVHVRRDDFLQYDSFLETRAEFLIPALKYIRSKIVSTTNYNISLLIFGDDYNFIKNLTLKKMFTSVNTFENVKDSNRGFEMCYSIEYCDTYLLSASSSSFGWLIGYLMKSNGIVYYNAEIAKTKTFTKYVYANDAFPPYWKKLNVTSDGKVHEK